MLCAKHKYDCYMIIDKCLKFYDLNSNKRHIFSMNSNRKFEFFSYKLSLKLYIHSQNLYM